MPQREINQWNTKLEMPPLIKAVDKLGRTCCFVQSSFLHIRSNTKLPTTIDTRKQSHSIDFGIKKR
jgi:hypothetical protein